MFSKTVSFYNVFTNTRSILNEPCTEIKDTSIIQSPWSQYKVNVTSSANPVINSNKEQSDDNPRRNKGDSSNGARRDAASLKHTVPREINGDQFKSIFSNIEIYDSRATLKYEHAEYY